MVQMTPAERAGRTRETLPIAEGSVELLEETIIPSPHVVELRRTPTSDYVFRFVTTTPHVAEVFHENSRISPHSEVNAIMDPAALEAARDWFYGTAYQPRADVLDEPMARELGLMRGLRAITKSTGGVIARLLEPDVTELAFALDLLILVDGQIHRFVPGREMLWLERDYGEAELAAIRACMPELATQPDEEPPGALLFLVGAAWRYMALQGPRGYRRTLYDAGRLVQALHEAAPAAGSRMRTSFDFYDARLDQLLKLDGVERATLVAIALTAASPLPAEETL